MTRDEALSAVGRYGTVPQDITRTVGPRWYGKVIDVHSGGDYVKFMGGAMKRGRWYHRRHVEMHPLRDPAPAA